MKKMTTKEIFMAAVVKAAEALPIDFDKIDLENFSVSDSEIVEGCETILGEMTTDQKTLLAGLEQITERLKAAEGTPEVGRLNAAVDTLHKMTFFGINSHFQVYGEPEYIGAGVREGNLVVGMHRDHPEFIERMNPLAALFGFPG